MLQYTEFNINLYVLTLIYTSQRAFLIDAEMHTPKMVTCYLSNSYLDAMSFIQCWKVGEN